MLTKLKIDWQNRINRCSAILLIGLLFAFCVSHAKAYTEVSENKIINDGGEWNGGRYWKFNLPSGRDVKNLDRFEVRLQGKVDDNEDVLPLWEIKSNYSGSYEKIGDINGWRWYSKTYYVTNGKHKYLVGDSSVEFGARVIDESGDDNDVWVEQVAVRWYFKYPSLWVSTSSLNFGNLYDSDRDGAEEYNKKQTKKVRVKNNGDPNTKLDWEITGVPSNVNVSTTSGSLSAGSEKEITVSVNPDSSGNFSGSFKINDTTISLSANVYGTPNVTYQNAKGSNNKINVGPNSKVTLEVKSGNPSFPSATIKEYEWQDVKGDSLPDSNKWTPSSESKKDFLYSQSVEYTVYCRMVDNNGVATKHASIPLRVWNAPEITEGAGDSWYGLGKYFVSVRNQPLFLQAETDLNGNKSIVKYEWKRDDKVIAISPGSQGLACVIYPVSSSSLASYNLTNFENYVKNNNISPQYSWTFETVNFPNSSGTFKHANQTDADGNVIDTGIANYFLAKFSGFLKITTAGNYTFYVKSDDGFRLRINNELAAQHTGTRGFEETSGSYKFPSSGTYSIELTYFDASGGQGLELRWDPPDSGKAIIPKSAYGEGGSYIFQQPNLSGRITCQAFTNYGVESKEKSFSVKIYNLLEVDITGETTGSPNRSVVFEAEIPDRDAKYPGYLSVSYDWTVTGEPELVDLEDKVEAKWNVIGDFNATVAANLSTKEGLSLSATSKKIVISISPAKPTAFPDGPYKGGIVGGNYSPIQFQGNHPDYIEAPEIGKIKTWEWNFLCPSGGSLDFDGENDYCYTNSFDWTPASFSVSWWFNPNKSKTAHGDIPGMPDAVYTGSQSIGAGDYPAWGAFQFGITGNGAVVIGTDTATAFNKNNLPDGTAEFNKWQHFTFTFDSEENTSFGTGKFYKNGVKLAERSDMAIPTQWNGFYIGSSKKANTVYGKVDDIAIWKRALSPGEVSKFIGKSPENELDCIAFWDFNDNTQPGADVIGLDNNFTLSGNPVWLDSGRSVFGSKGSIRGGALRFDGDNDYVKLDTTPFTSSSDFTIALWANPDEIAERGLIWGDRLPSLRMTSNGGLYYSSYDTSGSRYERTISNFFAEPEKWVHITWVKSGTSYKFYLNGKLQGEGTAPSSFEHDYVNAYYIGKYDNYYWDGNIDEVCVWNKALSNGDPNDKTDDEIVKIGTNPREFVDGLVLYFDCEQGSSLTLLDQSDLGKNGLLYNGTNWLSFNEAANQYNATFAYAKAGTYTTVLRVRSEYDEWSDVKKTKVTVIDGGLSGLVKAADLRTPVKDVQMTLVSSHVDPDVLASIADENTSLFTTGDGGIYTWTDETGYFSIEHLPLGNYRLTASKVENGKAHEFENPVQTVELTLESPNKHGFLYTDISVFPVSGRIVYSIQKNEQDVFVKNAVITAQPAGNASPIKSLPSAKSPDATGSNYNLPLFAGRYMFIAERGGHDIRLNENSTGYDKESKLVTITNAVTDIDFVDYTTRELFVYVEDSGGFPIDTYQSNKVKVQVNGDNGFVEDEVITENKTYIKVVVPPGKYTVSLSNVPTAYVKGDTTKKKPEVILENEEAQTVTMVVPVPITLEITPEPHLLDPMPDEFLEDIGLTSADNPEGYMIYFPPEMQTHTYTIRATANGNPVRDFNLKITDDISQLNTTPASEKTYPGQSDGKYKTDSDGNGLYTISAGWPNRTIVDPDNSDTYLEYTLPDSTTVKVPKVLPKKIKFQANKDGYEESPIYPKEVTVLGDMSEGSEAVPVAVPNVNYFVLHDPPGDGSYSYIDDSMSIRGILTDVTMRVNDTEIPVYPSPWSVERDIDDVDFDSIKESGQDLGNKGLLGYRDSDPTAGHFTWAAALEGAAGMGFMATGPIGYALHLAKMAGTVIGLAAGQTIQYEVSPNRHLETNSEDELPDLNGPGKGDIYYGEGWTLALQTKYRLGIKKNPDYDSQNPNSQEWIPDTAQILTYDIMERNNQYVYTVRDIVDIVTDLKAQVAAIGEPGEDQTKKNEKEKLENAISTWENLLTKNLAYMWHKNYINGEKEANRANLEDFFKSNFNNQEGELLIFSGGATFEYSRTISEANLVEFSTNISVSTDSHGESEWKTGPFGGGGGIVGLIVRTEMSWGGKIASTVSTSQEFGASWESGTVSEQTVGFVLTDDDVGDNISTYVFEGPWGTPIFFTDPGSVTSDPWQKGTNKAVDVRLELLSAETWGPFDYRDGAHYQFKVTSVGRRKLEGAGIDFLFYDLPLSNSKSATVKFNGSDEAPYKIELFKDFVATDLTDQINSSDGISLPSATIMVSIYPPEKDWKNSQEVEYPVLVQSEEAADYQIAVNKILRPKFADLRSPRATITAPYNGQRISPAVFTGDDKFKIQAFSDNHDTAKIQIEIRSKKTDGVWEPWRSLSGMVWADPDVHSGATNDNITIVPHSSRDPVRREFTFEWSGSEIENLGVGEYSLRAVAEDKTTLLNVDGVTQEAHPNVDLDAPATSFQVDGSKPTVLTTTPFYQNKESERIYRGELSVAFNDDMRATDFSDRTFEVTDLLNDKTKVAGFVSYSPALRKTLFVPQVPFRPNGFYFVTIKTDKEKEGGGIEKGVHDLAGNPLDNEFTMTFRTKDTPFEETWSIVLSATDGISTDANNIAAVEFGALDGEDERDAHAVPKIASQFDLSFLNRDQIKFNRDTRPADGRLSHHWFFVISNPSGAVTISYQPSVKLAKTPDLRQYKVLRLIEFDTNGNISNTIALTPKDSELDTSTGKFTTLEAYIYTPAGGETVRHFRLDVMKASFVATTLVKGSSKWKFFSAPIKPNVADPFVNLGDDIEPFKLYKYDTKLAGYKIYPLDIGEVSLITGHGYFLRLENDVEVDIGGAANNNDMTIELADTGWHAIGTPFIKPVNVADLKINGQTFDQAVSSGLIGGTIYSWKVDANSLDAYEVVDSSGQIKPWEGDWLETKSANLTLTIPAPAGLGTFVPPLPDSYNPPLAPSEGGGRRAEGGSNIADGQFSLKFVLTSNFASDLITALGTRQNAKVGFDTLDQSEPPILEGTVAAYFNHKDWQTDTALKNGASSRYNTDYQPALEIGETRTWELVVYTNKPKAKMRLSWDKAIEQVPPDTMLYFHQADSEDSRESEAVDMRKVRFVNLESQQFITKELFEIRAERFAMALPENLSVIAGEKQVKISWAANDNPFITGYTINRMQEHSPTTIYQMQEHSPATQHEFLDTNVEEEATYTYQIAVHFKSGAELKSQLFSVTVLPIIKKTVLLQSYPNPFNPDTWIPYELDREGEVTIEIYDVSGHLVHKLNLGVQSRGRYVNKDKAAYWNGRTKLGEHAASGIYFYVMKAGDFVATRKMAILK